MEIIVNKTTNKVYQLLNHPFPSSHTFSIHILIYMYIYVYYIIDSDNYLRGSPNTHDPIILISLLIYIYFPSDLSHVIMGFLALEKDLYNYCMLGSGTTYNVSKDLHNPRCFYVLICISPTLVLISFPFYV